MANQNSIFAIFHVGDAAHLERRLAEIQPWLSLKIEDGQWMVMAPYGTTSKEVCERVGIDSGASTGVVVRVDSYFGVTQPSIWEWLASKQGIELGAKVQS